MSSLFDLPFEDEPLDPDDLRPLDRVAHRTSDAPPPADEAVAVRSGLDTSPDEVDAPAPSPPADGALAERPAGLPAPPIDARPRAAVPTAPDPSARRRPHVFTVSELTHAVRQSLEHQFPRVWVEGEIADCSTPGGHVYFTLKDGSARLSAVLWRTDAARLRFKLTTGLHVLAKGRISVYPQSGKYQLYVDSVEPRGEGALRLAFEQLRQRLQVEGLFAADRKRRLPLLPRRIGVVTSLDGAALRDVIRVLRTRRAPAEIVISPTRVQGEGAAGEIARAIARVSRVPGVDVLIVGRGGGSLEDLWAFNEETVARAIAASPVPVISAVGHETDTTIADFVADVRAATPSQAAEIVVRQASEFRQRIATARQAMTLWLGRRLDRQRTRLLQLESRPALARFRDRVLDRDRERADLRDRLDAALQARVDSRRRRVGDLARRLDEQHPHRQLTTRLRRLTHVDERLHAAMRARRTGAADRLRRQRDRLAAIGLEGRIAAACRRVDQQLTRAHAALVRTRHGNDRRLSALSAQLDALSPLKTLGRGYAICWDATGTQAVRSVASVAPGDRVHVQLPDGILHCDVEDAASDTRSRP